MSDLDSPICMCGRALYFSCPTCDIDAISNLRAELARVRGERDKFKDYFENGLDAEHTHNEMLLKRIGEMEAALRDLIEVAETHAMQTYDRSGVTRRKIVAAQEALAPTQPAPESGKESNG